MALDMAYTVLPMMGLLVGGILVIRTLASMYSKSALDRLTTQYRLLVVEKEKQERENVLLKNWVAHYRMVAESKKGDADHPPQVATEMKEAGDGGASAMSEKDGHDQGVDEGIPKSRTPQSRPYWDVEPKNGVAGVIEVA